MKGKHTNFDTCRISKGYLVILCIGFNKKLDKSNDPHCGSC